MPVHESPLNRFRSKADTLQTLSGLLKKSLVEPIYAFTESHWGQNKPQIVNSTKGKFGGKTIIVRSSALSEDTAHASNAGAFTSVLDVDSADGESISSAIDTVIESYREKGAGNPDNPILIQTQTLDTVSSGILLTRDYNGSPYYVINYTEGADTAAVTSGSRRSRFVKLLKSSDNGSIPQSLTSLVEATREIEQLAEPDQALDIEFGIKKDNQVVTFQVRPLVAAATPAFEDEKVFGRVNELKGKFRMLAKRRSHLAGEITYFGDMPDWNPAEIIGSSPHLLAASLYDEIITDSVWHKARTSQGYTNVGPAKLVVQFGNKPYVDIRNTFNSFIPADISPTLRERLVDFYLGKLRANPQLQDKVEFEVLYTCYDLGFNKRVQELVEHGFYPEELSETRTALLGLTNNLLNTASISSDLRQNEELEKYRQSLPALPEAASTSERVDRALGLLDSCKESGTLQFSRLARLAFIGKTLLKSMVNEGLIDEYTYYDFLGSITTVASDFARDMELLNQGNLDKTDFLKQYGHLRPGTYDIQVPRYDASDIYFAASQTSTSEQSASQQKGNFELQSELEAKISETLSSHGLKVNATELFGFVRLALEAREYSKFLFSKSLSDAMEVIALAGEKLGFSREDVSHLNVDALKVVVGKDDEFAKDLWGKRITQHRADYELNSYIALPPVIFSEEDFEVVSAYESRPNYITSKKIQGDVVLLRGDTQEVTGKIVIVEAADPGYDWLFAKKPAALITKYGGPASHMAVRCAELGLPAIIGAGDLVFESLLHANSLTLDCGNQKIDFGGVIN